MFKHDFVKFEEIKDTTTSTGRTYHTPAGDFPSITTVLGRLSRDAIKAWKDRVGEEEANKISSRAGVRGTKIHKLCETHLLNENVGKLNPLHARSFNALRKWLDKNVDIVKALEIPMYSEYLTVAGRCDCVVQLKNGSLCIVDFKTALRPKTLDKIEGYLLQATAYCIMFEERFGMPINKFAILIAVDDNEPQYFYGKRDDYVNHLQECIKEYYYEKRIFDSYISA
jgi:hypothetical protein